MEIEGMDEPVSVDVVSNFERQRCIAKLQSQNLNVRIFRIGDQVEDILLLVNHLKEKGLSTFEPVEMRFAGCATLKGYTQACLNFLYP